jgi:Domain of unknown function (DUF6285)
MHESPSSSQLLSAVAAFLTDVASPNLTGHAQFSARVSANALALVARELAGRGGADADAMRLYGDLLGQPADTDLASLESQLCAAIASDTMTAQTQKLLSALRHVTTAQVMIDQPTYSGLKP